MNFEEAQKYRWFYTSSGKLVVGGKNAIQNEQLLRIFKAAKKDFLAMHTSEPGSPFSVIYSEIKKISKKDIQECAIFTASFSRAWKEKKKITEVDIFNLYQLIKSKLMKIGTWGVKGKIKKISVPLELVLIKQKSKLRAVPESVAKSKKQILLKIVPGEIDKQQILPKLQITLNQEFNQDELLSALPAGGTRIIKNE